MKIIDYFLNRKGEIGSTANGRRMVVKQFGRYCVAVVAEPGQEISREKLETLLPSVLAQMAVPYSIEAVEEWWDGLKRSEG